MGVFLYIVYLCFGVFGVILTVYDKYAAKNKKWRVPEKLLFAVAILGGSAAMYITMLIIRHKTKHLSFMLGLPIIMLLQTVINIFII